MVNAVCGGAALWVIYLSCLTSPVVKVNKIDIARGFEMVYVVNTAE